MARRGRFLRTGHPERKKKLHFMELIVNWLIINWTTPPQLEPSPRKEALVSQQAWSSTSHSPEDVTPRPTRSPD
jgi:hypothetical protein